MRRLPRYLVCATVLPAALAAQSGGASAPLSLGVYAGGAYSALHGDSVPGPQHIYGFIGGAFIDWSFAHYLAFQPEVDYAQKGSDAFDVGPGGGTFKMHIRMNYLQIPALLRLNGDAMVGGLRPYLIGGPAIAFDAGCAIVVTSLAGNYTCSNLPSRESVDYSLIGGGGVDVPLMGRRFTLSARYDLGLRNVYKNNDAKNRAASVLLGIPLWQ